MALFKSLWAELKYLQKLKTDPKFLLKQKSKHPTSILSGDLPLNHTLNQPKINSLAGGMVPGVGMGNQKTDLTAKNSVQENDPLKQQIKAEQEFASYQFQQGKEVFNNGGPQTAADLQNQDFFKNKIQDPNTQFQFPSPGM